MIIDERSTTLEEPTVAIDGVRFFDGICWCILLFVSNHFLLDAVLCDVMNSMEISMRMKRRQEMVILKKPSV